MSYENAYIRIVGADPSAPDLGPSLLEAAELEIARLVARIAELEVEVAALRAENAELVGIAAGLSSVTETVTALPEALPVTEVTDALRVTETVTEALPRVTKSRAEIQRDYRRRRAEIKARG